MTEREREELLLLRRIARTATAMLANEREHKADLARLLGEWNRGKAASQSGRWPGAPL